MKALPETRKRFLGQKGNICEGWHFLEKVCIIPGTGCITWSRNDYLKLEIVTLLLGRYLGQEGFTKGGRALPRAVWCMYTV
jgi:hypothetical protein